MKKQHRSNQAIPLALEGRDLIGQAQTGTGKTAAFGIPFISKIAKSDEKILALIMTPTRELAIQVAEEIEKLTRFKGLRSLPIYGGQDIGRQIRALKRKPQIIIGTPGRLLDHINRKTIRLDDVQTVVLDEADEMLDMGFMEDIQSILKQVPDERQTMLFSATMPPNIQKLAQQFLNNPEHISVIPKHISAPLIDQSYIEVPERQKFEALSRLLIWNLLNWRSYSDVQNVVLTNWLKLCKNVDILQTVFMVTCPRINVMR